MAIIETAIVLQQSLLEDAEAIANQMNISRSQLLERAVEEFVQRHQVRQAFSVANVDEAYADAPDPDDERLLTGMRRLHRYVLEHDD